jgi:hypothetical protein
MTILLWANSCKEFDELQIDPNRAVQTHPSLILTNLEVSTFRVIDANSALASRMMVFTDGTAEEQYYNWQRSGFGRYNQMRQATKMQEEAERLDLANYLPLALFFNSIHIVEITKTFGDVPYSDALQATSGEYSPAYDTQEEIFLRVLDDLKEANNTLDPSGTPITGDVIYGGDILKWKKLINSYTLRILMSLSNKTGNTALDVKDRFNEILSNPEQYPVFDSNDDNGSLYFYDLADNRYPFLNSNNFKTAYYMEESFVNLLIDREDPRLFTFADPKPQGSGLPETDFTAYGGLDGSAPLAENTNRLLNGEGSRVDARYYSDPVNEPSVLMGYAELEFTLAEAAARDWTTDDEQEHYENGIRASMDFYGISTAAQDAYLTKPGVAYVPANGLEMILTQKYINFFLNGGWEAFYNQRRTGFPEFSVDGGGVLNNEQVPKRWMYPEDELILNRENVKVAIERQFPEGDNINAVMWLLKAE